MTEPIGVLFVCLGNICRSPLAEGVFRHVVAENGLAARFLIDSAGTGGWHIGSQPDRRSIDVAARHGIDLTGLAARKLQKADFGRFSVILGMDDDNVLNIRAVAAGPAHIAQFHAYATGQPREIDDPYYGGPDGFETAYQIIRSGSGSLMERLLEKAGSIKG